MRSVIFDLDGTLIEPRNAICRSINYALREKGFKEVSQEKLLPYIGRHLLDPFRKFTGINDENELWNLIHLYRKRYETVGIKENQLYPGISSVLSRLRSSNYIASIKPWHASKMILKELGIDKYFTGVYGAEVDGTRADKIEILKYLKEVENVEHAVMIGDRDVDILAAKSCNFASIAVTYGYGPVDELKSAKPDMIVNNSRELGAAILKIWKS